MVSVDELLDQVAGPPVWGGSVPGHATGFTLPDLAGGVLMRPGNTMPRFPERRGIRLINLVDSGALHMWPGPAASARDLEMKADARCTGLIILEGPGLVAGRVTMHNQNHPLVIAGSEHRRNVIAHLRGTGTAIFLGQGSSANSVTFLAQGDTVSVQVGDDAMISDQVKPAPSDSNGIFELSDPTRLINAPASLLVRSRWRARLHGSCATA